ncbi:20820_t:CDS:2 [Rhizophagus irregularis]|nr:20820_t:CDS:2 [Rhizophagus irregularis]
MASSTNVRKEISRLYNVNSGITDEEFSGLLAYIVVNPNKVADIEECLKYGNDRVRLRYLRTLLSSRQGDFPNLDSLKNIIKEVVKDEVKDIKNDVREIKNEVRDIKNELSGLGFKIEQDFNKLIRAMDSIDLFTSIVMEKGAHIGFPLVLTTSSKRSGNGRFTSPSNKNADPKEEEIQQYFINECKELERTPNIKNN